MSDENFVKASLGEAMVSCDRCGFIGDANLIVFLYLNHRGLRINLCLNCLKAIGKMSRKNERVMCDSCGITIPKEEAMGYVWDKKSYCQKCFSKINEAAIREHIEVFKKMRW